MAARSDAALEPAAIGQAEGRLPTRRQLDDAHGAPRAQQRPVPGGRGAQRENQDRERPAPGPGKYRRNTGRCRGMSQNQRSGQCG